MERPDSLELLLPGEEVPVRRAAGADLGDLIDTHGLLTRDGASLVAPYAGEAALLDPSRLVAAGVDRRTGRYRLALERSDGNREVLFVEPESRSLVARRVQRADGTVLLASEYDYGGDPEALSAEKVDSFVPGEESSVRVRFRERSWNVPMEETTFRCPTSRP